MLTKADKRSKIRNKKKFKRVQHWIWAWSPSFIHLRTKKKKKVKNNKPSSFLFPINS